MLVLILFLVASATLALLLIRIVQVHNHKSPLRTKPARTMIILGSGGHTTEMLTLTEQLDRRRYTPRIYVVADNDPISAQKANDRETDADDYQIVKIPRSRAVLQSYASATLSTVRAFIQCVPIVFAHRPDVVLSNGPGTCVPIVLIVYLMRLIGINSGAKLVFVESYCRVKSISLSGKLLKYLVDLFVVQWPQTLQQASGRAKYLGKLM